MGVLLAALFGLLTTQQPAVAVIGAVALVGVAFSLRRHEFATLIFILILFTNSATIAVRFHGVPFIVGAVFPLLLMVPFMHYVVLRHEGIIFTKLMALLSLLLLVQIIGTMNAFDIKLAADGLFTFVIEGVVIYFLLVNAIRTRRTLVHAVQVVLVSTILLSVFPLYQQFSGDFKNNFGGYAQAEGRGFSVGETLVSEQTQQRLAGAIGEKNRFAQIMMMMTLIAFAQIRYGGPATWRALAIGATVLAAGVTILPFSRGAAVGFVLLLIIGVMLQFILLRQLLSIAAVALVMMLLFPQYMARLTSLQTLASAVGTSETLTAGSDHATEGRLTEMLSALVVYGDHPIVGVGPGMYRYYSEDVGNQLGITRLSGTRQAHNLYLDIAASTGTLGFVTTMAIVVLTIVQLMRVRKLWATDDPQLAGFATGFGLAILAYMTTGLFLHFAYIRYFWTVMGLAGATITVGMSLARNAATVPVEADETR